MWPCWIYITWDAMPVTTRIITFFGSGILINLHLPLPIRAWASQKYNQPAQTKKEPWRAWQRHTETLSRTGYLELGDCSQFFQQMTFQAAFRPFWDIQIGHHRRTVIWKKVELVCFLVSKKPGNLANDRRLLLGKIVLFGDIWVEKKNSKSSTKIPTWFSVVFNHLVF